MLSLLLKSEMCGKYSEIVGRTPGKKKKGVSQMIVNWFINGENNTFSNETEWNGL